MSSFNKVIYKIILIIARIVVLALPTCSFPFIIFYVTHLRAETDLSPRTVSKQTQYQEQTEKIPMLNKPVSKGDVIHSTDLKMTSVPQETLSEMIAQDQIQLVGMEAKRSLSKDKPILLRDIGNPTIIRRNDEVSMIYKKGSIELLTSGRALENGGVGETIKVMNSQSKKIVSGKVNDSGEIDVTL